MNIEGKPGEAQNASLGQRLRSVGQGLESLDVEDFELQAEGDGYFVLGMPRVPLKTEETTAGTRHTLKKAWRNLFGHNPIDVQLTNPGADVLRILFTTEGLLRLEQEGKARRTGDSSGIPSLKKLAQVLRMVGECIEKKSGRLLKATKFRDRISFEYVTVGHDYVREEWKVSDLFEFWLDVSNLRRERYQVAGRALAIDADKVPIQS